MSVSIVIPCLNEEDSIVECVRRVKKAFSEEENLEILISDNGSTDRSHELAIQEGARVVEERRRGYGAAVLCGLREAKGDFVVIGDADNTYDFEDSKALVQKLYDGYEFAIGNRLAGQAEKGAMPWAHQHIGTPILGMILNFFYGSKVKDINCGLRAIRRDCVDRLKLRSPGMEFASEMVIHAQKAGLKIAELPIRYYRRRGGDVKLRTFRDGWRHLRFILLFAPFYFFVIPGLIAFAVSLYFFASSRLGLIVLGSLSLLSAFQIVIFGILAKTYLWTVDSFVVDRHFGIWIDRFKLEYGILKAVLFMLVGVIFFGQIDIANLIRGSTFLAAGVQIFFCSFLISIILFKRRDKRE